MYFDVKTRIRELGRVYDLLRTETLLCADRERPEGLCDHEHEPIRLPAGVIPYSYQDPKSRVRVVLVRFTKRAAGGYHLARGDNGRHLGWVCPDFTGERGGAWAAYAAAGAFRGQHLDHGGSVMDDVPLHLFNGEDSIRNRPVGDGCRNRADAADEIVNWLGRRDATALTGRPHPSTREHHNTAGRHFPLGDDRCSCGRVWPCPRRAELAGYTTATAAAR